MDVKVYSLLLIVLTGCGTSFGSSKEGGVASDLQHLSTCLYLFRDLNGRLPTQDEGLQVLVSNPTERQFPRGRAFLKEIPRDPWGSPYQYTTSVPDGQQFGLYSFGPDRISQSRGNDLDDLNSWPVKLPSERNPRSAAIISVSAMGAALLLLILFCATRYRRSSKTVA